MRRTSPPVDQQRPSSFLKKTSVVGPPVGGPKVGKSLEVAIEGGLGVERRGDDDDAGSEAKKFFGLAEIVKQACGERVVAQVI